MKKSIKIAVMAIASAAVLSSCSTTVPISATSNPVGNKCGEASTVRLFSVLGGSANIGINKAAKKAGITKISHVDQAVQNYILYTKITTRVYGE